MDCGSAGGSPRACGVLDEGAVVATVTVILAAEFPVVRGFGATVHVDSAGAPVQVKLIVTDSPPKPLKDRLNTAGLSPARP